MTSFIDEHRGEYGVEPICRVLPIAPWPHNLSRMASGNPGAVQTLPAGTYDIDTEEEIIEGNERTVYLRVLTLLHVRTHNMVQTVMVDPKELQAAFDADDRS